MELEQLALEKNFSKLLFNINSKKEKSYKDYHNIAVLNFFAGNKEEAMSFFNENKGKNALTLLVYAFISIQLNSSVKVKPLQELVTVCMLVELPIFATKSALVANV